MIRYIAFLRAINVGGHKLIKMKDLEAAFASLGFRNVKTFIQSGNVLFESGSNDVQNLTTEIENMLTKFFGSVIEVFLRTKDELEDLLSSNPFSHVVTDKSTVIYIAFMYNELNAQQRVLLESFNSEFEQFCALDKDIYVLLHKKEGFKSLFSNNFLEKKLKVPATTRNITTVSKISELFNAPVTTNQKSETINKS